MARERTRQGTPAEARNRRIIAARYLDMAEVAATDEGTGTNNVVIGIAVLAGIAASDAISISATGARYAGEDHAEAARYLSRIDRALGVELSKLVRLKAGAHYGSAFFSAADRTRALRAAGSLVVAATERTRYPDHS